MRRVNQHAHDQLVQRDRLDSQQSYFQTSDLLADQRERRSSQQLRVDLGLAFAALVILACLTALAIVGLR